MASVTKSSANTASSFTYDGLGRLVRIVDTHDGAITADRSFFWCGPMRCLAHDNTQTNSPVSSQYFDQGVIVSATAYYYVTDQLGSVAELVNGSGAVSSQYTYDPYGNRTVVTGAASDIGYAGYFYHANSGLDFTLYRAYDSVHARWLNRDPIGEAGGINIYAYVGGNPVSLTDRQGLKPGDTFPTAEAAAIDALNYISGLPDCSTNEYANFVYQNWSLFGGPPTFTYEEPVELSPKGGILQPPQWHKLGAIFHNHPPVPGADSNRYSPQDEDTAGSLNIPSYLETPGGTILRYTPVPQDLENGNVTTIRETSTKCGCQSH